MRVEIDFYINEDRVLRNYVNEAMTSYIYRAIKYVDKNLSTIMHDEGIRRLGHKRFNFFTYDLSQAKVQLSKSLNKGMAKLIISSAIDDVIISFVKGMFKIGSIQIFGRSYEIMNIKHETNISIKGNSAMFHIPHMVYGEGAGRVWLNKKQMEAHVTDNLTTKYYALYDSLPKKDTKVKLINTKEIISHYQKDVYKGFKGNLIIEADNDLMKLAYDAGVGIKTGLGMGLLELIR